MRTPIAQMSRLRRTLAATALVLFSLPGVGEAAEPAASAPPPSGSATSASIPPVARLYVRDGQVTSHIFTVMVTDAVTEGMKPKLYLTGSHWVQQKAEIEKTALEPFIVAPRQSRVLTIGGQQTSVEGTLLMFDLGRYRLDFYESAVRLLPRLEWTAPASATEPSVARVAVAEQEIYLGSLPGASLWTAVTMLLVMVTIAVWSKSKSKRVTTFRPRPYLLLLTGPDGYLSLWRAQLMLWTFTVGSLVFLFGLVRLKVPDIPDSLVALMGLSLLTGLAAKGGSPKPSTTAQPAPPAPAPTPLPVAAQAPPAAAPKPAPPNPVPAQWADLVSTWNSATQQVELSVPKAQMVLWTVIIVALFCVKSLLDGTLWEVPWQMVALTGFSQAGYVGDKLIGGTSS